MTKALRKAILTRSRLKDIYNKKQSYDNLDKYKTQINFFATNPFAKQNGTTSVILILEVSVIPKNSAKPLTLISVTKDEIPIKYPYLNREGL